jgi:hypothetical protein
MSIRGEFWFRAVPRAIWEALANPQTLAACMGGRAQVAGIGPRTYAASLVLQGSELELRASLGNLRPPSDVELQGQATGASIGSISWKARLALQPDQEGSLLSYEIEVSGESQMPDARRRTLEASIRKWVETCFSELSLKAGFAEEPIIIPSEGHGGGPAAPSKLTGLTRGPARSQAKRLPLWLLVAVAMFIALRLLAYFES